jgi:endonuclease G
MDHHGIAVLIFVETDMGQLDRIKEARRAVQRAAVRRWQERAQVRGENRQSIADGGEGAADSAIRNERFRAREETFERARELRRAGRLPFAIERKIGATLDYSPFAPSDGARRAGRPVARVVELRGQGVQPVGFGTSFLVTPQLLLTNHHVFPSIADTVGTGANFLYEQSDRGLENGVIFEIDAGAFYLSDEKLDFALVGVKPRSADGRSIDEFGVVTLIEATPKILIGQRVNIIQHPDGGPKQYATTQNRLIDLLEDGFLHYETDTLEGSSGSPAFSENWELVGLHHAAIPKMRDGKVIATDGSLWVDGMGDDKIHWIANEGIRVSSLLKHLNGVRLDNQAQAALLTDLLRTTSDPADEVLQVIAQGTAQGEPQSGNVTALDRYAGGAMPNNTFNISGPVTINIGAHAAEGAIAAKGAVIVEKAIRFDRNYDNREGYDPDFLGSGLTVPVPAVDAARDGDILKDRAGRPLVLKYNHFELVMHEKRRLQMWSAVNVDYDPDLKGDLNRKEFGTDKWIPDPRIPERLQIFDSEFYAPAGNIDRGHIVRREDNAWGDTDQEVEFSNSDTFHWTNCTPQHEAFNQSAPGKNDPRYIGMKGLWGDFENYIQQNLKDDTKACILAGPVLDAKDPAADFGAGRIQYPLRFWKVIAVPIKKNGAKKLRTFGFVLSQRTVVRKFGIEVFRPGRFEKYQMSLAEITKISGVTFDKSLHKADAMQGNAAHTPIVDGREIKGLRELSTQPA